VSLHVDSAQRDTWHEGRNTVDGPDADASSLVLVGNLRFGVGRALEGNVSVPFAWMSATDPGGSASDSGIGDLLTEVRWNRALSLWSYGLSGGLYWPLGELQSDGLPATATFSTGTFDPTFSAYLSGPGAGGFGWTLTGSTRLVVSDQSEERRLGSTYTSSLWIDRTIVARVVGQAQLIYFHREEDSGRVMEPSGGHWIYLSPGLSYTLFANTGRSLQATLALRIPLLQDVVGRQLVESPALNFGLGYTVEF